MDRGSETQFQVGTNLILKLNALRDNPIEQHSAVHNFTPNLESDKHVLKASDGSFSATLVLT